MLHSDEIWQDLQHHLARLGGAARLYETLFLWDNGVIDAAEVCRLGGHDFESADDAVRIAERIRDGILHKHRDSGGFAVEFGDGSCPSQRVVKYHRVDDLADLPPAPTHVVAPDGGAIQCLVCGRISHHPEDVAQRYCAYCRQSHPIQEPDHGNKDEKTTEG